MLSAHFTVFCYNKKKIFLSENLFLFCYSVALYRRFDFDRAALRNHRGVRTGFRC